MSNADPEFLARYGAIYEHSPWVAEQAAPRAAALDDVNAIAAVLADCVDNASREQQLALIRAHPDLAGKAQIAGELTEDSRAEQTSAGLDRCSAEEFARFEALNAAYKGKFGFPFVLAVRGLGRADILELFEQRLDNDPELEFANALTEIHKIARLRLGIAESGP